MTTKIVPGELIVQEKVKSKTSNNEYDVYIFDNCVICTCPAGGKKQLCKHLISLIHKNFDMLKTQYPEFCELLMHVIDVKNNKEIPYQDKFKEYAKVIFLNKEIAQESIKNIDGLVLSDIDEAAEVIPLLESYKIYDFYEFFRLSKQSLYNIFFAKNDEVLTLLNKGGYINIHKLSVDDFLVNISFTKDELLSMLERANIQGMKSKKKNELINVAIKNNLFAEKMQDYCVISATEKLSTSKFIGKFLYSKRSKYVDNGKKQLYINYLREDCNIKL